jgi:rhamnose transport system ATP-binding protein
MSAPLLQLTSVTKSFDAVRALKGVSFDLRAGEVHGLVGENGAGKSTLIKVITGAHPPDGGTIEIDGQPVRRLTPAAARRLGIACIYQQPALFPELTVVENIAMRLEPVSAFRRVNWPERRTRVAQLLQLVGAHIALDAEVRRLSMPEQQLVEIACALGVGARIVIMDEPTAALTQTEQYLLFGVVRDLRRRGAGVIYISHRLDEVFALADRVTVLRDGESVGTGRINGSNRSCVESPEGSAAGPGSTLQPFNAETTSRAFTESEVIRMMIGREISQIYPPPEGESGGVVLELKDLGSAAGGVRNVNLDVRAGEIVGLAGLVGAGRTELARILFGITPADAGEIVLNGQRVVIRSPQEAVACGIAYVPEDRRRHGVIVEMPIGANMTMAIHRRLFPGAWLNGAAERRFALRYIRDLDIRSSGPDAAVGSLSGGNQQKVALARWLGTKPKLLILDEPTQGVDVGAKSEIHKIIRRLAKEGMAVLMISSDLPEVLGMSDRIAVMRGGTVAAMLPGHADAHDVMAAALGQTDLKNPNAECQMTKEARSSKHEKELAATSTDCTEPIRNPSQEGSHSRTGIGPTSGIRNSEFGFSSRHFRELSVAAALGSVLLFLAIAAPGFYQAQPLLSLLTREAPALVVACGMALVIICRQIDISVGSQFAVCSVGAGMLAAMNWPSGLVCVASVGMGTLLGAINGALIAGLRLPAVVVTLATMVAWREGLRWLRQGEFVNLPDGVQWLGLTQSHGQVALMATAFGLFVLLAFATRRLAVGRFVYAVGSDAEAARLAGIRPRLVTFCAFALMGALTGVAGLMNVVQSPQVDPKSGAGLELKTIAAVVVGGVAISGGRGNLWGVLVGLLLLACVSPALTYLHVEAYWEKAVQGGIILLAVVAEGLRGRKEK